MSVVAAPAPSLFFVVWRGGVYLAPVGSFVPVALSVPLFGPSPVSFGALGWSS